MKGALEKSTGVHGRPTPPYAVYKIGDGLWLHLTRIGIRKGLRSFAEW